MKKLSKAERKKLFIIRERADDLLLRMKEMYEILTKRESPDAQKVLDEQSHILDTVKLLESIEHQQYLLEYEHAE